MIDLKGERPECHIHPGGSARAAGYGWHFAHAVIQTKGNCNERLCSSVVYAFYAVLMLAAADVAA